MCAMQAYLDIVSVVEGQVGQGRQDGAEEPRGVRDIFVLRGSDGLNQLKHDGH